MGEDSVKNQTRECRNLIRGARVMTLASCDAQGPWSAPVYYIWESPGFYFFSNPGSRHILAGAGQGLDPDHVSGQKKMTAASIYKDDKDPAQLGGVQMSGIMGKAPINAKSLGIAKNYCHRFGIQGTKGNLLEFFLSRFRAKLYWFEPQVIYYMDNRRGMGTREEIVL